MPPNKLRPKSVQLVIVQNTLLAYSNILSRNGLKSTMKRKRLLKQTMTR